jgi:hypothetical protein
VSQPPATYVYGCFFVGASGSVERMNWFSSSIASSSSRIASLATTTFSPWLRVSGR